MSWSINYVGKPKAILAKAREDQENSAFKEPEQTIRKKIYNIIEAALLMMPDNVAIEITGYGSQTALIDPDQVETAVNNLRFEIKPLWNFLE